MTDFTRTREALHVYDDGKPARSKAWDKNKVPMTIEEDDAANDAKFCDCEEYQHGFESPEGMPTCRVCGLWRPDYIKCVAAKSKHVRCGGRQKQLVTEAVCGRRVGTAEWTFTDWAHAEAQEGLHVTCERCTLMRYLFTKASS